MAFTIDIRGTDNLKKSLEAAAASLDKVSDREKKANGIALKLSGTMKLVAYHAKKAEAAEKMNGRASKKKCDAGEKKKKDETKNTLEITKGAKAIAGMATALVASSFAAAALAYKLADIGKGAFDARRNSAALVSAFTDHKGGVEVLAKLDVMAKRLGQTVEETRGKFVEYRAAGFTTNESAGLLKTRADLMAVGLSAEAADHELQAVVSSADRMGNAVSHKLLSEIQKAYGGIGSGAKAAQHAVISVEAAQNKLSDAFTDVKANFWKSIAPDIGRAAHRLADFTAEFLKSKEGKEIINGMTTAFKDFASAVNEKNILASLRAIQSAMSAIGGAARGLHALFSGGIGTSAAQLDEAVNAFDRNDTALAARAREMGIDVSRGISAGIEERKKALQESSSFMGDWVTEPFASKLEIRSPSKVFARYGKNIVDGLRIGEERELGKGELPAQEAASAPPSVNASSAPPSERGRTQINVTLQFTGDRKDAQEIGRTVRDELQKLLQAGALSQGYA